MNEGLAKMVDVAYVGILVSADICDICTGKPIREQIPKMQKKYWCKWSADIPRCQHQREREYYEEAEKIRNGGICVVIYI